MCPYSYYQFMRTCKDKKQLRYQMVVAAEKQGIKPTARDFKVSRTTVKKWLRRWREEGYQGLADRSRRPKASPLATPQESRRLLVKLKKKYKRLGAEQIQTIEELKISAKTMRKIWRQEGVSSRKRRKKHVTKQNLRAVKRAWALFQQIDEDTKDLVDIPEYWSQMKSLGLPTVQYTARDVTSGITYLAFAQERSMTFSTLFAEYLNHQLHSCDVDLSKTIRQTDNGSEYTGGWQAKEPSAYTLEIQRVKGQIHSTIPAGAHRYQADVETLHNLIEVEFFELEQFTSRRDFLEKAFSYQLFFNLERPNTYKENQTPWQIAKKKKPDLPVRALMIPPVFLDDLWLKRIDFNSERGQHVPSVPFFS